MTTQLCKIVAVYVASYRLAVVDLKGAFHCISHISSGRTVEVGTAYRQQGCPISIV